MLGSPAVVAHSLAVVHSPAVVAHIAAHYKDQLVEAEVEYSHHHTVQSLDTGLD